MNTMKKRVLSGVIAAASAASMALPVFAATNMNTEITGTYSAPEISVTVPTTGRAVINPYGLGTTATKSDGTEVTIAGQIATGPLYITNESTLKLSVGASVLGEITARGEGDTTTPLKFATASTKGNGTNPDEEGYVAPATAKSVYVKLQVADTKLTATVDATDEAATAANVLDAVIDEYVKETAWTEAAKKELVVGIKEVKGEELATLGDPAVDADGDITSYKAGSIVMFRLTGDCTESPKTPWDEDDGFKVNVAFTFKPAPAASGN